MIASAQDSLSAPVASRTSNAKKTIQGRQLAVGVGSRLLWPAFAAGSFIFGINEKIDSAEAPYKTPIVPTR